MHVDIQMQNVMISKRQILNYIIATVSGFSNINSRALCEASATLIDVHVATYNVIWGWLINVEPNDYHIRIDGRISESVSICNKEYTYLSHTARCVKCEQ